MTDWSKETAETKLCCFMPIRWADVVEGQEVFIRGTDPSITGPFQVKDKKSRLLENWKGRSFMHYPEDLFELDSDRLISLIEEVERGDRTLGGCGGERLDLIANLARLSNRGVKFKWHEYPRAAEALTQYRKGGMDGRPKP